MNTKFQSAPIDKDKVGSESSIPPCVPPTHSRSMLFVVVGEDGRRIILFSSLFSLKFDGIRDEFGTRRQQTAAASRWHGDFGARCFSSHTKPAAPQRSPS